MTIDSGIEARDAGESGDEYSDETLVLSDLLNLVFDKGVVITGSVIIGIADVDLVKVSLDLVISSAEAELRRVRGPGAPGPDVANLPVLPPRRSP